MISYPRNKHSMAFHEDDDFKAEQIGMAFPIFNQSSQNYWEMEIIN